MAIRNDVDRAGIPQISMAGGTAITAKFDKLVFQTPWSNTLVVPYVLNRMKELGYTKIALISGADGYGKDGKAVIEAEAPKAGITIVSNQTFNPGDADVSAQLTKMKASGAQAMLMWTAGKDAANIVKTAKDLGITQPWFGGSGQARKEFPTGAGDAAEGFEFGTGKSLLPTTWGTDSEEYKVVSDFASRYQKAYGEHPDIFAGPRVRRDQHPRGRSQEHERRHRSREAARRYRGYQRAHRFRRQVHVLADRPQRSQFRRPHDVRDQGRHVGASGGEVAENDCEGRESGGQDRWEQPRYCSSSSAD